MQSRTQHRQDSLGGFEPHHVWRHYRDRVDAGERLAEHLTRYADSRTLVLGLPRGGVPVAAPVAERLGAELDVIVARKIGAPSQQELAIGAITASGVRHMNQDVLDVLDVSDEYIARASAEQRAEAARREQRFRSGMPALDPKGRVVILVDDGIATGATLRTALHALKEQEPAKVVVAVPVGAVDACEVIESEADELVCLHKPEPFFSVGAHYEVFDQTSDDEVVEILARHRAERAAGRGARS